MENEEGGEEEEEEEVNTGLLYDEDAVVELLPLEERVHVLNEETEVFLPVAVRDDDGHFVVGPALARMVATTRFQPCFHRV